MTSPSLLTIGDLARRTGVSAATLRMWESRHGFPKPQRLESGHRRYRESDVATVAQVMTRRDAGSRLESAIAAALDEATPSAPSVYASLRSRHPHLHPQRLRKTTLLALSWAIEDEFCIRADPGRIFGGFQRQHYYESARQRWDQIARLARTTMVFAELDDTTAHRAGTEARGPVLVPLPPDAPMRREWFVVCDSPSLPVVLTAYELPGQDGMRDRERLFEAVWGVDPVAVRDAARVCLQVAGDLGVPGAHHVRHELSAATPSIEAASVAGFFNRMVSYVDQIDR